MSNLWFNIRFGLYPFQCGSDGVKIKFNECQKVWRDTQPTTWKRFAIYCAFW